MVKHLSGPAYVVIYLVVAAAVAAAYVGGFLSVGALVFLEFCTLALAVIAWSFWKRMTHPPEIVEQILYETDHPKR